MDIMVSGKMEGLDPFMSVVNPTCIMDDACLCQGACGCFYACGCKSVCGCNNGPMYCRIVT